MPESLPTAVPLPLDEIAALCRRHGVVELAVFGSILGGDFGPESDVDFLARFENDDLGPWMSRLVDLERDLARLLGRRVDVVDWRGIERSRNPYRRHGILAGRRLLYAA
jgi:uncharacterized protein